MRQLAAALRQDLEEPGLACRNRHVQRDHADARIERNTLTIREVGDLSWLETEVRETDCGSRF